MASELLLESYQEIMDSLRASGIVDPPKDEDLTFEQLSDIGLGKARALLSIAVSISAALVHSDQDQRDWVERVVLHSLSDALEAIDVYNHGEEVTEAE